MRKLMFLGIYGAILVVLILIILLLIKRSKLKKYRKELEELDRAKNEIESAPVVTELAKIETIIKNEKLEEKYKKWFNSFENIKNDDIPKINDMLIELDSILENNDSKSFIVTLPKVELEIYKARQKTDTLLDEIKEMNLSEEKYRKIITKLKTKYRELNDKFNSSK